MSASHRAGPFGAAGGRPFGRADIHVHIGRLVVDRAALADSDVRGLHDDVSGRITLRLDDGAGSDAPGHTSHPRSGAPSHEKAGLSDVVAAAVAEQVSPHLAVARARARRRR